MEKEKLTIIKVGGKIVEEKETLNQLLHDFSSIDGFKILVHGGGRSATKLAAQLGIESKMVDGRRITDAETLKIVTMVYGGLVNKNIVAGLQAVGVNALGLTGADMNIIRSDKRPVKEVDYGYVGDVKEINAPLLVSLIRQGIVPVGYFDVTLMFCFEKKGVLSDVNNDESVIPCIDRETFKRYVASGVIQGGMIPKLENAFQAIDAGVHEVIITKASEIGKNSGTKVS